MTFLKLQNLMHVRSLPRAHVLISVCVSLYLSIYTVCVCLFCPDLIGSMDQDHQTITDTSLKEGISKIELTNCHQEQLDMNFTVGGTFLSVLKHVQTLACFGFFFRHLFNIVI